MCEYCTYFGMCNTKVLQSIQYVQYYPFSSILKYPGIHAPPWAAAQIGQITAKMGEMGDMLKATAEANSALQDKVVALTEATAQGRAADQQAHAEQQVL